MSLDAVQEAATRTGCEYMPHDVEPSLSIDCYSDCTAFITATLLLSLQLRCPYLSYCLTATLLLSLPLLLLIALDTHSHYLPLTLILIQSVAGAQHPSR